MRDIKKKKSGHKSYTPWHILLDDVMAYFFDLEEIEVRAFEKLGSLPLESDFIILRKKTEQDLQKRYPAFKFLLPYLGQVTVLEYKSPLDRLCLDDFDLLRVYRLLIKKKYKIKKDAKVWAVTLASHFEKGYAEYLKGNGYEFKEVATGVWGHEGKHERFYWLDLAAIGRANPESFINLFSSNYRQYGHSSRISEDESDIISYIWQSIFKEDLVKMRQEKLKHLPEFTTSMEEIRKRLLNFYTVDEKLEGVKPEDLLDRLKPEDLLDRLKQKEVLNTLSKTQLEELKKLLENKS